LTKYENMLMSPDIRGGGKGEGERRGKAGRLVNQEKNVIS
jgi:hypothetical protein